MYFAAIGKPLTLTARRPGIHAAARETASSTAIAPASVRGSFGPIPTTSELKK